MSMSMMSTTSIIIMTMTIIMSIIMTMMRTASHIMVENVPVTTITTIIMVRARQRSMA